MVVAAHRHSWEASRRCWAEEMNKRDCQIDIHTIRKNPEPYPDCLAEMDGKKIGVEVIELVCREAIEAYPENPQYEGPEQFLRKFSIPMPPCGLFSLRR